MQKNGRLAVIYCPDRSNVWKRIWPPTGDPLPPRDWSQGDGAPAIHVKGGMNRRSEALVKRTGKRRPLRERVREAVKIGEEKKDDWQKYLPKR